MKEPKEKKKGCLRTGVIVLVVLAVIGAATKKEGGNSKPPVSTPKTSEKVITAYSYKKLAEEDISYGATKRLVLRIRLDTDVQPEKERMMYTAKKLWKQQSSEWDEVTVFMIYGGMEDFNYGAYAMAEYTPDGLQEFNIHTENYDLWKKLNSSNNE